MTGKPDSKRAFERMIARHKGEIDHARMEIERARRELDERLSQIRAEMNAAREAFDRAIELGAGSFEAARKYRDTWGEWPEFVRPKRRPRRGLEGGEPLPVEPRPKPKPLIDGAEAPID
jgi:hypothetical protein